MNKDINISDVSMEEEKKLLKKFRTHKIIDINAMRVFFVVFFCVTAIAAVPVLRPTYSESEKRTLAKFPKFSVKNLVSGDFFDGMNLWFSDTFPFRDNLVGFNSLINGILDRGKIEVHGEALQGDKIPDVKPSGGEIITPPITKPPVIEEPQAPAVEKLGAIMIVDDAAYEYYNFNRNVADAYAAYINRAAIMLKDKANVYDMIIPTSMAITAPKEYVEQVNTDDQKKAIDYMYSIISPDVKKIDVFNALIDHKKEYIFFRSDHHWTALGAYYAYCSLMNEAGKIPATLFEFTEHQFEGYLGSFYSASNKSPKLSKKPDTVFAYEPKHNTMTVYYEDGTVRTDGYIVADGNKLNENNKYLTFIHGDRPLGVLYNPDITDGSSCIVIKESFGNAFVPFLTANYSTVYVVDYRYFSSIDSRTLLNVVEDTGAKDVIFLNNISATRNSSLVNAIGGLVGEIPA